MCISPKLVWIARGPEWVQEPAACKICWRCKSNRLNDYVARAMCEASTSEVCCTVTMTYGPRDDLADKVVTPPHFQAFIRALRRSGHLVRYLVAGEFGDLKGRVHFHAILFFQKLLPLVNAEGEARGITPRYKDDYLVGQTQADAPFCRDIPNKRMVHIREWPHGHIKVDWSASERAAKYVCKYLLSEDKKNAWFSLSKKPALGAEFFAQKAAKAKELGVLPQTFEYLPPGGTRGRKYLMTGASRRDYLEAITTDNARRGRMSEWVQKTFDKLEKERFRKLCESQTPEYLWERMLSKMEGKEPPLYKVLRQINFDDIPMGQDDFARLRASLLGFENVEAFYEWHNANAITELREGTPEPRGVHPDCCSCEACLRIRHPKD